MSERSLTAARRTGILAAAGLGVISVNTLARELGVSPSTIRRDLSVLAARGALTRTYGGAATVRESSERPLTERSRTASKAKRGIALWAAAQIGDGETVIVDAGTTAGYLAQSLRTRSGITVITPGLTALLELANAEGIHLVLLGGHFRHISQGTRGPLAERTMEVLTADRAFLGADGITAEFGVCEAETSQTRLKEMMIRRSRRVYVVADSSKIDKRPFNVWAALPSEWTLVTDDEADVRALERFADQGAEVVAVRHDGSESRHLTPRQS